jgi:hypothetical protein
MASPTLLMRGAIDLARLVLARHEAEMRAHGFGVPKALGPVDG